jgi:tetratricopeptide (TPR) repeat protein
MTLAYLALLMCAGQAWGQQELSALIKRIQPAVITVIAYDAQGQVLQQGSGFFITEQGQFVTNRHVLQGAVRAHVKTGDGTLYDINAVLAEDEAGDLLQGRIARPKGRMPWLPITRALPEAGERIVVVGSPLGLDQTVTDGIVSAIRDLPGLGTIVQITAPLSPGSSGSPVVNLRGEVVGMATAQMRAGHNLNFAIPGERMLALKSTRARTLVEWTTGRTQESLPTAEALFAKGSAVLSSVGCAAALPSFEQAVAINPRYAAAWRRMGECQAALYRSREAAAAFQQLVQLEPQDISAYSALASAYRMLDRKEDAIIVYKQALHIAPNNPQLYIGLCSTYISHDRELEAVAACRQAMRIAPNDPDIESITYFMLLDFDLDDLIRLVDIKRDKPKTLALQQELRQMKAKADQQTTRLYQQAIRLYQQAIQRTPNDAEAYVHLANVYKNTKRHREALAALTKAIGLKPDHARAHFMLGSLYSEMDRWQDTTRLMNEAIRLTVRRPADASMLQDLSNYSKSLAYTYEKLGRYENMVKVYQQLVQFIPDDVNAYASMGRAYEKLNRWQDAAVVYQQIIRLEPDDADAYTSLGDAYKHLNRWQDTLAAYQQATRLNPNESYNYLHLGEAYSHLGRYQDALAAYQHGIHLNPNDFVWYFDLGQVYEALGRWHDAVTAYQQRLRFTPNDSFMYFHLGKAYEHLGRWHDAVAAYQQGIRLKPDNAYVHFALGAVSIKLRDKKTALAEYQILKTLDVNQANRLLDLITQ